jgi:hypothetical protein
MVSESYRIFSSVMILIGLGTIILAFMNSPLQLQIALGLAGLGFISLGLIQIKRGQVEKSAQERLDDIMLKLDEIEQELQKEKQPGKGGVAIADIITSGLKYYADHVTKQKEQE